MNNIDNNLLGVYNIEDSALYNSILELPVEESLLYYELPNKTYYDAIYRGLYKMRDRGFSFLYFTKQKVWISLDVLSYKFDDIGNSLVEMVASNITPNNIDSKDLKNIVILGSVIDCNLYKAFNNKGKYRLVNAYNKNLFGISDALSESNTPVAYIDGLRTQEDKKLNLFSSKNSKETSTTIETINDNVKRIDGVLLFDGKDKIDYISPKTDNLPNLLKELKEAICNAFNVPYSRMWGTSESIWGGAGTGDITKWDIQVRKFANLVIEPTLESMNIVSPFIWREYEPLAQIEQSIKKQGSESIETKGLTPKRKGIQ